MEETEHQFTRGDVVSRRYEIEQELGGGMLGVSYVARHISSGKLLAIKFLKPTLVAAPKERKRFEEAFSEARAVRHDGLVRLGEIGEHDGAVYFTQEYVTGQSLRELINSYLAQQKVFSLQEACQIILKTLDALQVIHSHDMVHRNIKPENIIVTSKATGPGGSRVVRNIKITDVGLANIVNDFIFSEGYVARGDARYVAPELQGFDAEPGPRADIFSVGIMLYELLVGQPPRGTYLSPTQLRGDLPPHIDDIVDVATAPDAEDRYPTAQDMFNDIQRSFSGDLFAVEESTSFKNILIGVGVVLAAVAAMGIYLSVREAPDPTLDAQQVDETVRGQVQSETPIPSEDEIKARHEDHPDMLYIPPGPYLKGRLHQESFRELDPGTGKEVQVASQSEPLAVVVNVDGFYIDRFEFPNRLKSADGEPVRPVAKASWTDAEEACSRLDKRICTEDEWEKACKGPGNTIYTYGDTHDEEMCGEGVSAAYSLGEPDSCVSGYGVWGLSGGKREWTATTSGSKGTRRVVKGGMRANAKLGSRCAFAMDEAETYADSTLSFRCCLDTEGGTTGKDPQPDEATEEAAAEGDASADGSSE